MMKTSAFVLMAFVASVSADEWTNAYKVKPPPSADRYSNTSSRPVFTDPIKAATVANRENLPLVIWVSLKSSDYPKIKASFDFDDAVHCEVKEALGKATPRVGVMIGEKLLSVSPESDSAEVADKMIYEWVKAGNIPHNPNRIALDREKAPEPTLEVPRPQSAVKRDLMQIGPPTPNIPRTTGPPSGGYRIVTAPQGYNTGSRPVGGPATKPFHAGHNCPRCGNTSHATHVHYGRPDGDGTHNHRCDRCGMVWKH